MALRASSCSSSGVVAVPGNAQARNTGRSERAKVKKEDQQSEDAPGNRTYEREDETRHAGLMLRASSSVNSWPRALQQEYATAQYHDTLMNCLGALQNAIAT